jgi:hypothetical protein
MSFLLSLLLHVGAGSTLLDLNCAAHLRLLYNTVKEMGYRYGANGLSNIAAAVLLMGIRHGMLRAASPSDNV